MLVEEIMQSNPIHISDGTTIETAMDLIHQHKIRHIPVVDSSHILKGIVSDRDIRDASPSIFHVNEFKEDMKRPVSTIMKYPVITAHPLDFIEEAAVILYENDISALPVVEDDDKLKGILTETEVLHTLVRLTGAHQPSSRIEVKVSNVPGQLAAISSIFKEAQVNVTSVLVYPGTIPNTKFLTFRVQTMDPRQLIHNIEKLGYETKWPRVPGLNE
ncbi:acetoin utilization protein AcuB [Salibacterium salarium]|uniref:acetoin utilization AcuB family protein n=1 Tax=Salibacterium salarium TaxID=284579 RepID=UPI00277F295C|nr:acetoin utilization AcuB family protein [Salibacterium salarium]MDQ0298545.1 acetoin utilization protein AcuB [Salibacterium salarium]